MKSISCEQVLGDYISLKKLARKYINQNKLEKALRTIFVACGFMYTYSQIYYDDELEQMVKNIGIKLRISISSRKTDEKAVLFYDGFGNDRRGLAVIYLKALRELGYRIIYVTYRQFDSSIGQIKNILSEEEIYYIANTDFIRQIHDLNSIISTFDFKKALLYMCPDDVVAVAVFSQYEKVFQRYLIDLTDYAFWLGKNSADYFIEYRSYGGNISFQERRIEKDKIVLLPFYPHIAPKEFQGFPFDPMNKKIVFSGGALYKTYGMDNLYYKMVEKILSFHKDVIFYYLGEGDTYQLERLMKRYPTRIIYGQEREDFFEVMKRCYIYLSTYPFFGGLMTQYAIVAGKLPITLASHNVIGELTVEPDKAWYFDDVEELYREVKKLLQEESYLQEREAAIKSSIITPERFKEELKNILISGDQLRCHINWKKEDTGMPRQVALLRSNKREYCGLFCRVRAPFLAMKYPRKFICGFFVNIYMQRIKRRGKR